MDSHIVQFMVFAIVQFVVIAILTVVGLLVLTRFRTLDATVVKSIRIGVLVVLSILMVNLILFLLLGKTLSREGSAGSGNTRSNHDFAIQPGIGGAGVRQPGHYRNRLRLIEPR